MQTRAIRSLAALALPILLGACGAGGAGRPGPGPIQAPEFDRDAERTAVLVAVLEQDCMPEGTRILVVDDTLAPDPIELADDLPPEFPGERLPLPGGHTVLAPDLQGLSRDTFDDWRSRAAVRPAPKDLRAALPISWFSDAAWTRLAEEAREATPRGDRWKAFHARYPGSSGWVRMSDVGFSQAGDQALVQTSTGWDWEAGSGRWLLLRHVGGRWVVVERQETWIA